MVQNTANIIKENHTTNEVHFEYINKKIKSLNKKLIKADRNPIIVDIKNVQQEFTQHEGNFIFNSNINFDISYEKPELCDWELVAVLNNVKNENIIHMIGDVDITSEVAKYKMSNSCDHCNHNRKRIVTYIVRNIETGEYVQVGKSCLSNFIGTDAMILEIIASLNIGKFIKESQEKNPNPTKMHPPSKIDLEIFLSVCLVLIETKGYKDRYTGNISTGIEAWERIVSGNIDNEMMKKVEAKTGEAKNLISWALGFRNSEKQYENAIATLANVRQVPYKYANLASSIYNAKKKVDNKAEFFKKVEEKKEQREAEEITKNLVFDSCMGEVNTNFDSKVIVEKKYVTDSAYGEIVIFKFRTKENYLLTWITSSSKLDMFNENEEYHITGKIKKYEIDGRYENTVQISYVKLKK